MRVAKWSVLSLLLLAGAWFVWHQSGRRLAERKPAAPVAARLPAAPAGVAPRTNPALVSAAEARTNRLAYRLSNTTRPIGQLMKDDRAILLENALIDSSRPVNFTLPANLQSQGDPGAYIVQSRGPINAAFRATLAQAGAQIFSYIPNDAYLVRATAGEAASLATQPAVQAVIPYEPYYKLQLPLLGAAVNGNPLPAGTTLNLCLFADTASQTIAQIKQLGATILSQDTSPFGPVVHVQPPKNWTALAALPDVPIVEVWHPRVMANDLSRVTVGVATNTTAPASANYLNLQGLNVMVAVADSGVDAAHPDLTTRVQGLTPVDVTDTNGHGTHVAGIIAGNGVQSPTTMSNGVQLVEGSVTNADFRGKAPQATLFSMDLNNSDQTLQQQAALTNALISNNSWGYGGDNAYDLAAASYDAATRDALSLVTGSQPMLFVFSAGNDGNIGQNGANGDDNGAGGTANTISSPGTAKNVVTVAALEQLRNITNIVTDINSNQSAVWQPQTDTGFQVAGYSSRGNVGIGIEGASGRFKPDVAAPGTFVVSTSSQFNHQWATNAYYNPTNHTGQTYTSQSVDPGGINYYSLFVPQNAVGVTVQIVANANSPSPFPSLPIYVSQYNFPDPSDSTTYDFYKTNNQVVIPPDGPGTYLNTIQGTGFNFAVGNSNAVTVSYTLTTDVATTNDLGNFYSVLEGMNDSLGGYYRYESGTSMAAADVSGVLALMADFFTNTLHQTPSPALLKAMLINGARPTGLYNLQVNNTINYEGWGLVNLPNTLPTNSTVNYTTANGKVVTSMFVADQSTTNALATGDSHTYTLKVQTNMAPLRLTLAWTDPPGDPIAAIKLVNSLQLVVTNTDYSTNPIVYYGNDIAEGATFNTAESATNAPVVDAINNVQSIIIPAPLGTNYTVTVIGREVNVNAVSAQTNNAAGVYAPNIVQDYALVVSSGNGGAPGAFTVTDNGIVSNPTGDQDLTYVPTNSTTASLLNQFVGANSPVMNTNVVPFTTNSAYGTAQDTLGTTNQWHFYVAINSGTNSNFTNAAFVIYAPLTLSVPRMGVFAGSDTNATLPQANIDLYASTDPTFTNLNPVVISNCINGIGNNAASLGPGGAKFIVFSNSTPGQVYYIGVKSEDQMASEYNFLAVFSQTPFNQMDHGDEIVNGLTVPVAVPGGSPSVPGFVDVVAIGIQPMNVGWVVVTNEIQQVDVGDLVSTLSFDNINVGLMTHNSPNSPGTFDFVYDDSSVVDPASLPAGYILRNSDGPGSLRDFIGQSTSAGVWVFHIADSVLPFSGSVNIFSLRIHPQLPATGGVTNAIPPHTMVFIPVDVPAGATNLTVNSTNITPAPDLINPLLMVLKFGSQPNLTNADKGPVALTNGTPVGLGGAGIGNSLSVGPSDVPPIQPGRYWVGITNQSNTTQTNTLIAVILPPNPIGTTINSTSTGSTALLDDAVTYSDIFVTNTLPIVSLNVGIDVQHPRISDLVFHLISPDGTRVLLMENRGGNTANAGATVVTTNILATVWTNGFEGGIGNSVPGTGGVFYFAGGWHVDSGTVDVLSNGVVFGAYAYSGGYFVDLDGNNPGWISTNLVTVPGTTYRLGFAYSKNPDVKAGATPIPQASILVGGFPIATLTVSFSNSWSSLNWQTTNYVFTATSPTTRIAIRSLDPSSSLGGVLLDAFSLTPMQFATNYAYLTFTEDTNLTTTPIKFAIPPFVPGATATNGFADGFEQTAAGAYTSGTTFGNGWTVTSNQVSVVADSATAYVGSNYLALANGVIYTNLPTVAGNAYTLTFAYQGPGIAGWWRGENDFSDSSGFGNNASAQNVTFASGEVNNAFEYGFLSTGSITVPPSASLTVSNLTFEGWINLGDSAEHPIMEFGGSQPVAVEFWANAAGSTNVPFGLYGDIRTPGNPDLQVYAPGGTVPFGWTHVALTVDTITRTATIYCNGAAAGTATSSTPVDPQTALTLDLGYRDTNSPEFLPGQRFYGGLDELSVYHRALSVSEIKAIYQKGTSGKFDPAIFATSPASSLAEAGISLNGGSTTVINGSNTNWQTETITFTATQNGTPLQITGLEPGMLLDNFTLTPAPNTLYYQPEQSLTAFNGQSAFGDWLLEIQDDRAGAGLTNALMSWQLQFVFANTSAVPLVLTGGVGQTNQFIPAGDIAWYQVNVPANASYATNRLLFASAPVNVWFSTNAPPSTNGLGDLVLIPNSTGATVLLSTNGAASGDPNFRASPAIYGGQTYYLGVENPNAFTVNYGIEVDFDTTVFSNPPPSITTTLTLLSGTGDLDGVGVKYLSGSLYFVGDDTVLGGLLGSYATPLSSNSVPLWSTNWPSGNPQDLLNGVTANSNGVYAAGPNYTRTVDTVGVKEQKGLVVKYPLGGAISNGFGGDIWDVQTPAPPGAFAYGGIEGLNGITLASENGTNFIYATGSSQDDGLNGGRLYVSKLAEDSTILWTANDGNSVFGEPYSAGEAITPLNGYVYAAGITNGNPYLRKYDASGNLVWAQMTATNGAYYGVCTYANFIFAVGGTSSSTNEDFLVDKWDDSGNLLWSRAYDHGSDQDEFHGVVNGNGHLFAVGLTRGLTAGGADAIILEISPATGNLISTNLFGGALDDAANGVDTDNTNLFVIGETKSYTPGTNQLMLIEMPLTLPPPTNAISNFNATVVAGPAIQLQWNAPTNYQFQAQWTTNLSPPVVWSTFTNIVTSTNGVFTFVDDGSQSGGLGGTKFYRLVEYPNP